jgi:hypothetical protein
MVVNLETGSLSISIQNMFQIKKLARISREDNNGVIGLLNHREVLGS